MGEQACANRAVGPGRWSPCGGINLSYRIGGFPSASSALEERDAIRVCAKTCKTCLTGWLACSTLHALAHSPALRDCLVPVRTSDAVGASSQAPAGADQPRSAATR